MEPDRPTILATRHGAVLRHARAEDWPRLDTIAIACWTPIFESFRRQLGDEIYHSVKVPPGGWQESKCRQVRSQFERHPECIWVVEKDGEVIAFVTFRLDADHSVGEIGNNGVHPDHAGQGWGTFMYRHVLDHFRAAGLRYAMVGTGLDPGHAPARRAYEAVGFDRQLPAVEYWQELAARNPGSEPSEG